MANISEVRPVLRHLSFFTYRSSDGKYKKISYEKTQYTYRFLIVAKGSLSVTLDEKAEKVVASDIIYLPPGSTYRLLPSAGDFTLYSIFFDFEKEERSGSSPCGCVFLSEYDENLCSKKIEAEESCALEKSGIFTGTDAVRIFELIRRADSRNPAYAFYASSQIQTILSEILLLSKEPKTKSQVLADKIVSYVYSNYDKNISAGEIAEHFSYHQNYINRLIKNWCGKSLSEFIRAVKIEHAIALISESVSIPENIFSILGYYDYSHFYKAFRKETGLSPSEYVKSRNILK